MDLIKNSSDLSSGRRPISKSDEFSIRSILVLEITGREFDTFPKNVYTYWDFGSDVRVLGRPTMKMKPMLGDETEDQNPGASFAASWAVNRGSASARSVRKRRSKFVT